GLREQRGGVQLLEWLHRRGGGRANHRTQGLLLPLAANLERRRRPGGGEAATGESAVTPLTEAMRGLRTPGREEAGWPLGPESAPCFSRQFPCFPIPAGTTIRRK